MTGRYFEGDHPELERQLDNHMARMRHAFDERGWPGSLVLGGGYGRGEGGVMREHDGEGLSNDLDYFLFDDNPGSPPLQAWCRQMEREESAAMGIDVEIKCLRADSLGDPSRSMMFADLVAGHVVVAGDGGFLTRMRTDLDFSRIEPVEATRLLWNRGSGIFFARCRLGQHEAMTFVIRNYAKLKLAMGDAWLCLHGQYVPQCRERAKRLDAAPLPAELACLRQWHAEGVAYKFTPRGDGLPWPELEDESRRLVEVWGQVYLAVEARRLQRGLSGFEEYLALPRLLPHSPLAKNLALAMRDRLRRGGCIRPIGDYPRAGLMRALPCLLGLTAGGVVESGRFLPTPAGDPAAIQSWENLYAKWWTFYA